MKQLLEESKQQLLKPLGNARRILLIILNVVYIILMPTFLVSEKIATGNFVNDPLLYIVYGVALLFNSVSAIYNIQSFRNAQITNGVLKNTEKWDSFFGYASVIPILFMSCCNMLGLGNPSNDSILTDFALAQSLMIVTVIIVGRKAVVAWFIIVVSILFWNVSSRGWDYEYHYLTPTEVRQYKEALAKKEPLALKRKTELEKANLNPPKISRYFNIWIVFTIVAFMVAYFFSGITIDILKVVPIVADNIEKVLEGNKRMEAEQRANQEKTNTFINLAHETKTPLTLLNNYVDEYIKKHGSNKEIEIIKWNVQRMTTDIVNFFDIERFNKGFNYQHNQITNLSDLLMNKLPLYKSLAQKKQIEIEETINDNCYVLAHPSSIERIMNNLIENALKFTLKNGHMKVSLFKQDTSVHFIVEDNGIGIHPDFQGKIFEPYFQLRSSNRNNEGMGMGLAIVKKIIDNVNGKITLFSDVNQGTKVNVTLPYCSPNEKCTEDFELSENLNFHFSDSAIRDSITDSDYPTLLIVEDNAIMLAYLVENFRKKYNVYIASNGVEALEKLHSIGSLDLIISDVMMDRKNGFDFCKEISEIKRYSHVPFIFITAKSTACDKLEGLRLGAVDYIEKPFLISQLTRKVESLLNNLQNQRVALINKMHQLAPTDNHFKNTRSDRKEYHSTYGFEVNFKKFNLTTREIEIINLIIKGLTYNKISENLNISDKTVAKHVQNIFAKVGATNKVDLINKLQPSALNV